MWYRLVGSSLEVYDVKTKDEGPLYVVTEAPVAVHEVKGVAKITDVNFRVAILSGDGGLNLFAADAADGKGWTDALARASDWDQLTSSRKVCVCWAWCPVLRLRGRAGLALLPTCSGDCCLCRCM